MAARLTRREFVSTAGAAAGAMFLPFDRLRLWPQAGAPANAASRERVPWKVQAVTRNRHHDTR